MFCTLRNLTDACVVAKDGRAGRIRDFLFDDQSWNVRYIVVSVRIWFWRRQVVLPISAIRKVDWEKKVVWVHLSKEEVRYSAAADSIKPVNRQQELALREYYRWPAYWGENWCEFSLPSLPAGREYPVRPQDDPHLRSTDYVTAYQVWDSGALIGRLEDFVLDPCSWHISSLELRDGTWVQSSYALLPTQWVQSISWGKHRMNARHASLKGVDHSSSIYGSRLKAN